ncbi:hypothetical protein RF11_16527 [Thelohanellus kitauei]|uniref:Uncharacterized protein n=1 Tax=Thelohanellus kitauei TaxID=669202 RepID=A0A0C2ITG6_THEKT|nr:hypothetical protein RF11_16527 [Thelohanellus kitauei]
MIVFRTILTRPGQDLKTLLVYSKDGGRDIGIITIFVKKKHLIISEVLSVKDHVFCKSIENSTFLYINPQLNSTISSTFSRYADVFPHYFYPRYVLQLVYRLKLDLIIIAVLVKKSTLIHVSMLLEQVGIVLTNIYMRGYSFSSRIAALKV